MEEEITAKTTIIKKSLQKHIEGFEKRRKGNRKKAIRLHFSITMIGAIITILSGIDFECLKEGLCFKDITRALILVLGALTTILGAYKTFFNNQDLWIKYTMTANSLKEIQSDFEFYLAGKNTENISIQELDTFKDRIQKILNKININWEKTRSE